MGKGWGKVILAIRLWLYVALGYLLIWKGQLLELPRCWKVKFLSQQARLLFSFSLGEKSKRSQLLLYTLQLGHSSLRSLTIHSSRNLALKLLGPISQVELELTRTFCVFLPNGLKLWGKSFLSYQEPKSNHLNFQWEMLVKILYLY